MSAAEPLVRAYEAPSGAANGETAPHPVLADRGLQERFDRDGYVVLPLLDAAAVAGLAELYRTLVAREGRQAPGRGFHATLFTSDVALRSAVHREIAARLGDLPARPLADYRLLVANFLVKEPGPSSALSVHQDWTFVDEERFTSVNVWVPLVDVDATNGAVEVLPGSHRWLDTMRGSPMFPNPWQALFGELRPYLRSLEMRAGEALVHSHRLVHFSPANQGASARIAVCANMVPRAAQPRHAYLDPAQPASAEVFAVDTDFFLSHRIGERPSGMPLLGRQPVTAPRLSLGEVRSWLAADAAGAAARRARLRDVARRGAISAVERAVSFIAARQLPSGAMPLATTRDGSSWTADESPFATSLVASCLAAVPGTLALAVRRRAAASLLDERGPGGLWRYWPRHDARHAGMPPDLDDSCCAAFALRQLGIERGPSRRLLRGQRDASGLFRTWVLPRGSAPLLTSPRLMLPLRRFQHADHPFWKRTSARPSDVDAAVNANVLLHLGDGAEAPPVAAHLHAVLRDGAEGASDRWYHRPLAVGYMVTRARRYGVGALEAAAAVVRARLLARLAATGPAVLDALDTALALAALGGVDARPPEADELAAALLAHQRADGSWPCLALWRGGPRGPWWGSAELTTALAVEALALYASEG